MLVAGAIAAFATILVLPAQAREGAGADRYIVVLKNAVDPSAVAGIHAKKYGAQIDNVWGHALHGYAAVIPNDRVAEVRADPNVSYVVADGEAVDLDADAPVGDRRGGRQCELDQGR